MLLTSAVLKQNSAISLEEWVLVFKVFTTTTRKLRVKVFAMYGERTCRWTNVRLDELD